MPPKKPNPPGNRRPKRAAAQKAAEKKTWVHEPVQTRGASTAADPFSFRTSAEFAEGERAMRAYLDDPEPESMGKRLRYRDPTFPFLDESEEEEEEVVERPRSRRGAAAAATTTTTTTKKQATPKKPTPPKQSSTSATKKRPHPVTTTDEDDEDEDEDEDEPVIPTPKKHKGGDHHHQTKPQKAQPLNPEDQRVDTDDENDFHEPRPAYVAHTYPHIQDGLRALVGSQSALDDATTAAQPGLIRAFAARHFGFAALFSDDDDEVLERLRGGMGPHAALLVGCVADGGPRGVAGWLELFRDPLERQALVCAVVGKVLEEHVFASLCFGATEKQLRELHEEVDLKYRDNPEDGFTRAQRRHRRIRAIIDDAGHPLGLPPNFLPAAKLLAWQLHAVLEPIRSLSATASSAPPRTTKAQVHALYRIVARAGILSLHMRLDASTVYHATGAGKGDFWNEGEMRAFNRARMVERNPTRGDAEGYDGTRESEKRMRRARYQLALVRTAIWPAWRAFKRGGWAAADKGRGFRVCELGRQWVSLRWGEQRTWDGPPEVSEEAEQAKGKAKAKKADAGGEERPRWEEWLTIWAEGQKDPKKVLENVKDWFSFSVPGEELESEEELVDDEGDDDEEEMLSESDL